MNITCINTRHNTWMNTYCMYSLCIHNLCKCTHITLYNAYTIHLCMASKEKNTELQKNRILSFISLECLRHTRIMRHYRTTILTASHLLLIHHSTLQCDYFTPDHLTFYIHPLLVMYTRDVSCEPHRGQITCAGVGGSNTAEYFEANFPLDTIASFPACL